MKKISGIYCIYNIINGNRYIGKSVNIHKRWQDEKFGLRNKHFHNDHLQRAWDKYGEDAFEFLIIEECCIDILAEKEMYWIDYFDSYNNGYNQTLGGEGALGCVFSDERKEKIRNAHLGSKNFNTKPVYCVELNQEFWGAKEAEDVYGDFYNISRSGVTSCCKKQRSFHGKLNDGTKLHWCYLEDKETFIVPISNRENPIYCIELNEYFTNSCEAEKDSRIIGAYNANIIACCRGNKHHKTCGRLEDGTRLTWRYASSDEIKKYYKKQ